MKIRKQNSDEKRKKSIIDSSFKNLIMQKVRIKTLPEGMADNYERMKFVPKATLSREKTVKSQLTKEIYKESATLGIKLMNLR